MITELGQLQAFLNDETRRANNEEKERRRLFVSEKCSKPQLRHISDDCEEVGDLQYQQDGAVGKKRPAQKPAESLQNQLDTA